MEPTRPRWLQMRKKWFWVPLTVAVACLIAAAFLNLELFATMTVGCVGGPSVLYDLTEKCDGSTVEGRTGLVALSLFFLLIWGGGGAIAMAVALQHGLGPLVIACEISALAIVVPLIVERWHPRQADGIG